MGLTYTAQSAIGVFDSGVGGISVLRRATALMPHEHFLYYGDSAHAPYGSRSEAEIIELSRKICEHFLDKGIKALLIACNTATAAAAETLRHDYPELEIIGIEPALKPAVLEHKGGHVLVMATPATLNLQKYHALEDTWGDLAQVTSVAGEGLVELIEQGYLDADALQQRLQELLGAYRSQVDAVVLGCTHYPFIKSHIAEVLGTPQCGHPLAFYDGGIGAAEQLQRRLKERALLATTALGNRSVEFESSIDTDAERALYERFMSYPL